MVTFDLGVSTVQWSTLKRVCLPSSSSPQTLRGHEASDWPRVERTPGAGLSQQARAESPNVPVRVGLHRAAGHLRGARPQRQSLDLRQGQPRPHAAPPQGKREGASVYSEDKRYLRYCLLEGEWLLFVKTLNLCCYLLSGQQESNSIHSSLPVQGCEERHWDPGHENGSCKRHICTITSKTVTDSTHSFSPTDQRCRRAVWALCLVGKRGTWIYIHNWGSKTAVTVPVYFLHPFDDWWKTDS